MTLLIDDATVQELLDIPTLVDELEKGFAEEGDGLVVSPPRVNVALASGMFRLMPVALNRMGLMGFKSFYRTGPHSPRYVVLLCSQLTSEVLAMVDGDYLTAARTGATTGVATRHLAPNGPVSIGVLGSGVEALTNLRGVLAGREAKEIAVFSPRAARRERFAARIADEVGCPVTIAESGEACVGDRDVVVVATNTGTAADPIAFRTEWVRPGQFVASIGSTIPALRELDEGVFAESDVYATDTAAGVAEESGDALAAIAAGTYPADRVIELKDLATGAVAGRTDPLQRTLFKSVGSALQDVVAAWVVYQRAHEVGAGNDVGEIIQAKQEDRA